MAGKKAIMEMAKVKLKIREEKLLGRSAKTIYKENQSLLEEIRENLQQEIMVGIVHREDKSKKGNNIGINPDSLNNALRQTLKNIENIHLETAVENGVFFEKKKKSNFDFSFYDRMLNYAKFWNYGRTKSNFQEMIQQSITNEYKDSWNKFICQYRPTQSEDIDIDKEDKTIVGEIQFGNWAMIYKDIFRLLRAKNSPNVMLYIYITDCGSLNTFLSSQIVKYDKALMEFEENLDIIDLPIWIIGLDIDTYSENEFQNAYDKVVKQREKENNRKA